MYDLERPFHRLIHHFVTRMFHGAGEGDELQFGIPALLGLLSVPSAFGAIELLSKYSTLRLFLTRQRAFDVYRASIPDEHFFIVYSMVITGAIVVLRWDRLFPDRRDFENLATLPISTGRIFMASLCALLFLAAVFAVDINVAACFIFPFAVTMRYDTFAAYSQFFVSHTSSVILSSFFACFSILCVLGATLILVPQRYVRSASIMVRVGCALLLIVLLASAFSIPRFLFSERLPWWISYVPSVWFLDQQQSLLGRDAPFMTSGKFGLEMTAFVFVLALGLYALTYRRQFTKIPEQSAVRPRNGRDKPSVVRCIVDAALLRTAFQQGTYPFILKTLFRSERHCLLFGVAAATGLFLAGQAVSDIIAEPARSNLDPRILSISLTLGYFIICSLRPLFDLPAERNANWIFQTLVDKHRHESRVVATKVMLTMIAPWLFVVALPVHIAVFGWKVGLLHTGYVLLCSLALSEFLLVAFRKIPFTCTHTASKDRVLVMMIVGLLGLGIFAGGNSLFERYLLDAPLRFLFVLPFFVAFFCGVRAIENNRPANDRILIFEDRPPAILQLLKLSR